MDFPLQLSFSLLKKRVSLPAILNVLISIKPGPDPQRLLSPRRPVDSPGESILESMSIKPRYTLSVRDGM